MKPAISHQMDKSDLLQIAGITLTEDENLISVAIIHQAIYWKGVVITIIGLLMLPFFLQNLGFFLMFVGIIMIFMSNMTRKYLLLAASDKRIFIRSGIAYTDMIELRYQQVESIELGVTPIGQIFGYGSVIVTGTGQRRVMVPFVKNAIGFRKAVNDTLVDK